MGRDGQPEAKPQHASGRLGPCGQEVPAATGGSSSSGVQLETWARGRQLGGPWEGGARAPLFFFAHISISVSRRRYYVVLPAKTLSIAKEATTQANRSHHQPTLKHTQTQATANKGRQSARRVPTLTRTHAQGSRSHETNGPPLPSKVNEQTSRQATACNNRAGQRLHAKHMQQICSTAQLKHCISNQSVAKHPAHSAWSRSCRCVCVPSVWVGSRHVRDDFAKAWPKHFNQCRTLPTCHPCCFPSRPKILNLALKAL